MTTPVSPQDRYQAAAHAMQSGVAMEMELGSKDTQPKHLRVGINSALSSGGALAKLLIQKGIFTEDEYTEAVTAAMEDEAESYRQRLAERLGTNVTLA